MFATSTPILNQNISWSCRVLIPNHCLASSPGLGIEDNISEAIMASNDIRTSFKCQSMVSFVRAESAKCKQKMIFKKIDRNE